MSLFAGISSPSGIAGTTSRPTACSRAPARTLRRRQASASARTSPRTRAPRVVHRRRGARGSPTQFNAAGSADSDGSVARYDWDFGDGTTLADGGPTPTHIYAAAGSYKVTLTLTDNEGCSLESYTGQVVGRNPLRRAGHEARPVAAAPPPGARPVADQREREPLLHRHRDRRGQRHQGRLHPERRREGHLRDPAPHDAVESPRRTCPVRKPGGPGPPRCSSAASA